MKYQPVIAAVFLVILVYQSLGQMATASGNVTVFCVKDVQSTAFIKA